MNRLAIALTLALIALPAGSVRAELVKIGGKGKEMPLRTLIDEVAEHTGRKISYDADLIEGRQVQFIALQAVPEEHLFSWLQSLLSFLRFVLVPTGEGEEAAWTLLRAGQPRGHGIYVPERDLANWADKPEAYVLTTIHLNHADAAELVAILDDLTKPLSGTITAVPSQAAILISEQVKNLLLIVELIRLLDTPSPETLAEIARLENLLAKSRTEAAAKHLVERIETLRRGRN